MKQENFLLALLLAVIVAASPVTVLGLDDDDEDDDPKAVQAQETIQKTFSLAAGTRSLEVDTVFGSMEVVGTSSEQIQLVATKSVRARSQASLERAQKEVTLDVTQEENRVRLYVNGPFRCSSRGSNCCNWEDRHYVVKYDFKLQVPQRINLELKTVNSGSIRVTGVRGEYLVNNVNGPIDMEQIGGSGRVRTVNGRVRVTFAENPTQNSEFRTINGNVDLYFAPRLAADFRFKTMNGSVYSDFHMTEVPRQPAKSERRNGRFVYSADRYTAARVGAGGPEIKLENLNGDLRVLAQTN
jgi:hypothetical protein